MHVRFYHEADAPAWDALIHASFNGTFLHTRRFLSYHGHRHADASVVLEDATGQLIGVMPAAVDPQSPGSVLSHPGLTYGGLIHAGALQGTAMGEALEAACTLYRQAGFEGLCYKAVPHIYHRVPAADDLYALFRLGAARYRCDLSATIDFTHPMPVKRCRRQNLQRARREGLVASTDLCHLGAFWDVLESTLAVRHGVRPVHSLAEIRHLHAQFPERLALVVALQAERVVAGMLIFRHGAVDHAQYMATSAEGAQFRALDLVIDHALGLARARGVRYFDYGISNERDGRVLNESLHRFKTSFGSGAVVHEFYHLPLR